MKRPSLASSMKALKEDVAPDPVALVAKARQEPPAAPPLKFHAATREGMKRLLTPVPPELHRRLKIRAAEQDTTLEALSRGALEACLSPADAQGSAVAAIVTKAEPKPADRTRSFLARAAEALRGAQLDDLAGLEITEEMEAAKDAVVEAWQDGVGREQWLKRARAARAADDAADKAATKAVKAYRADAIAAARTPEQIRATKEAFAQAKVEDHAVAFLRDELGGERFAKFVGMFHHIRYMSGFDKALWRIGELVPNIECGTVINPETGDKARVGIDGSRWIEKASTAGDEGEPTTTN